MDVAFYLVYPETSAERPKLTRFRDWLLGQAVASLAVRDAHPTSPSRTSTVVTGDPLVGRSGTVAAVPGEHDFGLTSLSLPAVQAAVATCR
jgi:hypothetical protein